MRLSSTAFEPNEQIPARYTCDDEDEHPPLTITGVPEGARSLALILHDPDAVSGDFTHWILWNIPPDTNEIKVGTLPAGAAEGTNDFGNVGYGGPCPPPGTGTHHYVFELYALDIPVTLPMTTKRAELARTMAGHEMGRSELVGLYSRDELIGS